jgi:CRISPR-associated endonuclease Cas1
VVTGYGLRLSVERGHLAVEGGIAAGRWTEQFSRVDRDLKRVVLIGHAGSVTLDTIRWLHGVGVPLVHLDTDGTLFGVFAPSGTQAALLRRAQALAPDVGLGTAISLDLVQAKIQGQMEVLERLGCPPETLTAMEKVLEELDQVRDSKRLRVCEATAARAYWSAWRDVPIWWAPGQGSRRPRHWKRVGGRASFLSGFSPRKATNPANAVLNYCFAILEAECQIACQAVGLDPFLGFLHTDSRSRASLTLDVMEPIRPRVETWVLELLENHAFTASETFELKDGECRLLPPLTEQLASTGSLWAPHALEWATRVARLLLDHEAPMTSRDRRPKRVVGREYRRRLEPHEDPRRGAVAGEKRRRRMKEVLKANRRWRTRRPEDEDPAVYHRDILPGLAKVPLKVLVLATGLSKSSCSLIRRGKVVPHSRHWRPLRKLTRTQLDLVPKQSI